MQKLPGIVALSLLLAGASLPAAAQTEGRIGFVNTARILRDAAPARPPG